MRNLQSFGNLNTATDLDGHTFGWSNDAVVVMTPASVKLKMMRSELDEHMEERLRAWTNECWLRLEDGRSYRHDEHSYKDDEYWLLPAGKKMPSYGDKDTPNPLIAVNKQAWDTAIEERRVAWLAMYEPVIIKIEEAVKASVEATGYPVVYVETRQEMGNECRTFKFWMSTAK